MKRTIRKLLSGFLALIMLCSMMPAAALAALIDNSPAQNREILDSLRQLYGSEEEAQAYYALLEQYGLLDETGNAADSWLITMDGKEVTLADIRALLDDPATDLEKLVVVDGTPISLGDLQTVLEIEEYIAYLRTTYFDGHQWTEEQLTNLNSLVDQINSSGIRILSAKAAVEKWPSGVNHGATVKIIPSKTGRVIVQLHGAELGQTITFDWEAYSGSQLIKDDFQSGTVTLEYKNGQQFEATYFTVELATTDPDASQNAVRSSDNLVYYLKLSNLTNASFEIDNTIVDTPNCSFGVQTEPNVLDGFSGEFFVEGTGEKEISATETKPSTHTLTQAQINSLKYGYLDTIEVNAVGYGFEEKADGQEYSSGVGYVSYSSPNKPATFLHGTGAPIIEYLNPGVPNSADIWLGSAIMSVDIGDVNLQTKQYGYDSTFEGNTTFTRDTPLAYEPPNDSNGALFAYVKHIKYTDNKIGNLTNVNWSNPLSITGSLHKYANYNISSTRNASNIENPTMVLTNSTSLEAMPMKVDFKTTAKLEIESISAIEGTYENGHSVPVKIRFNRPVLTDSVSVRFSNDTTNKYHYPTNNESLDNGIVEASNEVIILYPVNLVDNATLSINEINATDITGLKIEKSNPGGTSEAGLMLKDVKLETPMKIAAVSGVTAEIGGTASEPTLEVSVSINNNEKLTTWMGSDMTEQSDGSFVSKSLKIRYGGEEYPLSIIDSETITGGKLTTSIPLEINQSDTESVQHVVELLLDGELAIGRYNVAIQPPAVYITASDLSVSLTAQNKDGSPVTDLTNTILYAQDEPKITASYTLANKDFTYKEVEWSSNNEDIALIDQDGNITPTGKSGTVSFTLTATNGGVADKAVSVTTDPIQLGAGLTPFLVIPGETMQSVAGQDLTVYWSTNLLDKAEDITFTLTASRGSEELYTKENVKTTYETIPANVLTYAYDENASNTITITVSATYNNTTYTDTATLTLFSQPAVVKLNPLDSYYMLDTAGSVAIGWTVKNFERFTDNAGLFEVNITSDKDDSIIVTNPGNGQNGVYTFTITLPFGDIQATSEDPSSYRKVYTVTAKAKNGADSTWSYDSFLLYVYDADALEIMVDGKAETAITMSNRDAIAAMDQEQILALNRDIGLKEIISVNYGTYAWTELADQIKWKSNDNTVATVNYQQSSLYDNIEDFTYVSYRPTTEFGLSGISDGTATITATHALTGMTEELTVKVETLKDRLYLFQCYPQTTTTLTYVNGKGEEKTIQSDNTGAAAIYEPAGISGDVYCKADYDGHVYLGTFYNSTLRTGEGDWTRLARYPCNNLELRRAAYAYLYLKNPDGTPYTEDINFRGGIYVQEIGVDDEPVYQQDALFGFDNGIAANLPGDKDQTVTLGEDGKLEVFMDQSQWGLTDGILEASDKVEYVFEISLANDELKYYPLFIAIDATANEEAYVGAGEAIAAFRTNPNTALGKHPFIASQAFTYGNALENILDKTGKYGPGVATDTTSLHTMVMWWEDNQVENPAVQLYTDKGIPVSSADGEYTISHDSYPFATNTITSYSILLDENTLTGVLGTGDDTGVYMDFYQDGTTLVRREELPFRLCNMIGVSDPADSKNLLEQVQDMGNSMGADAKSGMDTGDQYVQIAMELIADENYTNSNSNLFNMQLAPTSDPTKFLGFIQVGLGSMDDSGQVSGTYLEKDETQSGADHLDYSPGLSEMLLLAGKKTPDQYLMDDYKKTLQGKPKAEFEFTVGGYMETLIYYDFDSKSWEMQILSGGFNAGAGLSFTWNWNMMVGPVPFTVSLTIGGSGEVSMDALSAAYTKNGESAIGTDYLTELRIYLYLRLFAGVGVDYAVVALKLGIYGQINLDMRFQWLNRPYLSGGDAKPVTNANTKEKMDGQNFKIDGQIGLEFVFRFLFIEYEKILYSFSFDLMNESTGQWDDIQKVWDADQKAYQSMIDDLVNSGSMSVQNVAGQQMLSLNLAPTLADNSYLDEGSYWNDGSFRLFALDDVNTMSALNANAYEYANPLLTDDGAIVAFLGIPGTYVDEGAGDDPVKAMFAIRNATAYEAPDEIPVTDTAEAGYGDSQLSISGTKKFAVAAWTRQMVEIQRDINPETGKQVLTTEDQLMMMNGTDVFASIYVDDQWTTTRLTTGAGADLAPVTATNGTRAIVAWRSVAASNGEDIVNFDSQDNILYQVYDAKNGWSETYTLYNGTSGNVKAIVAHMLENGTAAVAYALDTDEDAATVTDREIAYAVIDKEDAQKVRTVFPTTDSWLDENPQLTSVKFGKDERFVLGWYTEQTAMQTGAAALNNEEDSPANGTTSTADIRLLDFDETGSCTQNLPDSIDKAASAYDVSITSNFRFTKNAETIEDLSILWVQRDEATEMVLDGENSSKPVENPDISTLSTERDTLKGVQFYTYGENDELIGFTGAVDVAEMADGTLIDFFDAYVSDSDKNEIKAVILGTTYGENGTKREIAETEGGQTVSYVVPSRTTSLYTATETYENKIDVPSFLPDYDKVKSGAKTEILFNVENRGIDAITALTIKVDHTETTYENLNLLPGASISVYGDYNVPATITDPSFTVTATFVDGSTYTYGTEEGQSHTIYLNLPDVEITEARVVDETEGKRTIQVKLNNRADAELGTNSDTTLRLRFFSDASYQTPIDSLKPVTIDSATDLAMVNDGGYSTQVVFDVAKYIGAQKEIPEDGVTVYVKAEVLDNKGEVQGEPRSQNNYAAVLCENLQVRTGKDVSVTNDLSIAENSTTVTVSLQNNRLTQTTTGNVVVTLFDTVGKVLAQSQSYDPDEENNGLVHLAGEAKDTVTFTFDEPGAYVQVSYTDLIISDGEGGSGETIPADLASLSFEGIPGIDLGDFQDNGNGTYTATAYTTDLTEITVLATTKSPDVKVQLIGSDTPAASVIHGTVNLLPGGMTTITLELLDQKDAVVKTYVLTVLDGGESEIETAISSVADKFASYPQSIQDKYQSAEAMEDALMDKMRATGADDMEVYDIGMQFSTDGSNWIEADAGNFPAAGFSAVIPYPGSTGKTTHNFTLYRMIIDPLQTGKTVGTWEAVDFTVSDFGIHFLADCFAVYVLGWERKPAYMPMAYPVMLEKTENGILYTRTKHGYVGQTVTLTATAAPGYVIDTITVTTEQGKTVMVLPKADGVYTFVMPDDKVSVNMSVKTEE